MTITYPRDLPSPFAWRPAPFDLMRVQTGSPSLGGIPHVVNVGRDYWRPSYETVPMREPLAEAFEAYLDSLRGGARLFRAWRPQREFPQSYASGFGGLVIAGGSDPFPGYGALDSVGGTLDTLQISDLPANFALKAGDMLSFAYSGKQALHRILEDATASGSGVVTLTVEPTIAPGYAAEAEISFHKPFCLAVIDDKSINRTWYAGRKASFAFAANQFHG